MVGGTPVFVVCDGSLLVESNTVFTFVFDLHVFEMYRLVRLSLFCSLFLFAACPGTLDASLTRCAISMTVLAVVADFPLDTRIVEEVRIMRDHSVTN